MYPWAPPIIQSRAIKMLSLHGCKTRHVQSCKEFSLFLSFFLCPLCVCVSLSYLSYLWWKEHREHVHCGNDIWRDVARIKPLCQMKFNVIWNLLFGAFYFIITSCLEMDTVWFASLFWFLIWKKKLWSLRVRYLCNRFYHVNINFPQLSWRNPKFFIIRLVWINYVRN